jgi:hypothetical protein
MINPGVGQLWLQAYLANVICRCVLNYNWSQYCFLGTSSINTGPRVTDEQHNSRQAVLKFFCIMTFWTCGIKWDAVTSSLGASFCRGKDTLRTHRNHAWLSAVIDSRPAH